jgi:hypothetical protein
MKEKLIYLNRISKIIDIEDFYDINLNGLGITLQGKNNPDKYRKYCNDNFKFHIAENGYVFSVKGILNIVLTD